MENMFEVQQIVIKHLRQEVLSKEESATLRLLMASEGGRELVKNFEDKEWIEAQLARIQEGSDKPDPVWQKIQSAWAAEGIRSAGNRAPVLPLIGPSYRRLWRGVAAAIVLVVAGGAVYLGLHHSGSIPQPEGQVVINGSAGLPGGDKAVLTLSDGRQINLDSSSIGAVADQGNVKISKLASGQLTYNALHSKPAAPAFNTLSTPRAGQFALSLPDGTKVWLNNASSLRYPVYFTGPSREVELTGEGYFEVAKNSKMPFKVNVHHSGAGEDGGAVEVLGTSFNVMAYPDEKEQRTTLVQGSIQIIRQGHRQVLQPEEQSVIDVRGQIQTLQHVNVPEVTAWKNGYFHFDHTPLEGTMRQLARWYDVEVEYKGQLSPQAFVGKIQRNLPLPVVLKGLENEHIHFQLEGRKLVVVP
jgi:transmembrane sensor